MQEPQKYDGNLVEFHQFHRTGDRKRGVIHVIVNPWLRKVYVGWSMCNIGRGDVFDPQVGRDIARKRCLKMIDKADPWRDVSPMTTNPVYESGGPAIPSYEWQFFMRTGNGGVPSSMFATLDGVISRIYRIINSMERKRATLKTDPPVFVGDDDHAKGTAEGNPIF